MLDSRHLRSIATRLPRAFSGATLHRWALEAAWSGDYAAAESLFEAGASRYRVELAVEPLARLRAHQLIARVRASGVEAAGGERVIEIERLLARLGKIESLEPPFALVDAHTLLAAWLAGSAERAPAASDSALDAA